MARVTGGTSGLVILSDVTEVGVLGPRRHPLLPQPHLSLLQNLTMTSHSLSAGGNGTGLPLHAPMPALQSAAYNVSNSSDVTARMLPPVFNEMSLVKIVVLSLMFIVSLVGNSATLCQMYRMRRRKSTINTLILHLATADLVVTFFCNITDTVWMATVQWYGGTLLCKTVKTVQVFGLYLSTYVTVIIALDRCYAILDPMSRNKAPHRVRMMVVTAYVLSALFASPQAYIFRVMRGPFQEEFYQCVTYGAYSSEWQEKFYSAVSVILMFIIPLVTMVTAYLLIFCTIARKSKELQQEQNEAAANSEMLSQDPVRSQLFRKAKVKSLRMTALIVLAFIICWTPYQVVFIIYTFCEENAINTKAFIWIFFFGMANSMVNPLIYGAFQICRRRRRRRARVVQVCRPPSYRWMPSYLHQCQAPPGCARTSEPLIAPCGCALDCAALRMRTGDDLADSSTCSVHGLPRGGSVAREMAVLAGQLCTAPPAAARFEPSASCSSNGKSTCSQQR